MKLFLDCKKFASVNNQSVASAVDRILQGLAKFNMDSTYPNGYDTNYGDSNYQDKHQVCLKKEMYSTIVI